MYNPNAIRAVYDEIAEQEDRFEKGFSLRNEIPRDFIRRYLRASDGVLDAAGGAGINAILMAQCGARVTLLDLSPWMLEQAAANVHDAGLDDRIDLVQGDITDLSRFPDGHFSFVVCLGGALSYTLEKGPQAIGELVRVARPGSVLILGCDGQYGFARWLLSDEAGHDLEAAAQVLAAGEYEAGPQTYARLYTAAELTGLLERAGCAVLEVASTPVLVDTWDQSAYPEDQRERLKTLELQLCTVPELLGAGHHLFCVARKQ